MNFFFPKFFSENAPFFHSCCRLRRHIQKPRVFLMRKLLANFGCSSATVLQRLFCAAPVCRLLCVGAFISPVLSTGSLDIPTVAPI
jgi:hypothetical protein